MRSMMIVLAAGLLLAAPAAAGDDWVPPVKDPLVLKECGACHMAFQPAFLPARAWRRMMDGLADHFGEDASLPPATAAKVRDYLTSNAGDADGRGMARKYMREASETSLRITENPKFVQKHRRITEAEWKSPKVVTRSNCPACHKAADAGWYEDD
jgi:hypothetical protein